MARDNPRWGAVRIQGELQKLGIAVSARSVRLYRRTVKRRPPSQSWQAFLRNHAPQIWAADFLTVQTLTFHTLYVFLFVTHERRRVVHLYVTAHPTAEWDRRQLIVAMPWGMQPHYLVRDSDRCYDDAAIVRLGGGGSTRGGHTVRCSSSHPLGLSTLRSSLAAESSPGPCLVACSTDTKGRLRDRTTPAD